MSAVKLTENSNRPRVHKDNACQTVTERARFAKVRASWLLIFVRNILCTERQSSSRTDDITVILLMTSIGDERN
jgi:hypothetical protein